MLAVASFALFFAPVVVTTGDMDSAYQRLQEATAGKDAVQVKDLAAKTCALARGIISLPPLPMKMKKRSGIAG